MGSLNGGVVAPHQLPRLRIPVDFLVSQGYYYQGHTYQGKYESVPSRHFGRHSFPPLSRCFQRVMVVLVNLLRLALVAVC